MSKMSKAIAVLGVVAGLGVAALPLSSYAAKTASRSSQVQVEVGGAISIAFDDPTAQPEGGATFDKTSRLLNLGEIALGGAIREGKMVVIVSTNDPVGYELKAFVSTENGGALVNEDDSTVTIPFGAPAQGTSAWSFKGGEQTDYITTTPTSEGVTLRGSEDGNIPQTNGDDAKTEVTVGVTAASNQTEGTYKGTITFTAGIQ